MIIELLFDHIFSESESPNKKTNAIINNKLAEKIIIPANEIWTTKKHSFVENENGLEWHGSVGEKFTKESWCGKDFEYIEQQVRQTVEYTITHEIFTKRINDKLQAEELLKTFVWLFIGNFFKTNKKAYEAHFKAIQKYINKDEIKYCADIALIGFIASSSPIKFKIDEKSIYLRRVTREDFPTELPIWADLRTDWFERRKISSILKIEIKIKNNESVQKIQKATDQAMTILRLFKVGSVSANYIQFGTEAFWDQTWQSRSENNIKHGIFEKALINDDEVRIFKIFWKKVKELLPEEGFGDYNKQTNFIEIAYQRYFDSLIASPLVSPERRIADAVMGIESLFLTSDEKEVISYRLKTRIAKVLGILGYNPFAIEMVTKDAYGVRSAFVHGDKIGRDLQKKINKRYDANLEKLLRLVSEELRISIIIFLVIKQTYGKENFIKFDR